MGFSFCICLMTLITSTSLVYYRDVPWMRWNTQSDLYYVLENGWWIWNRGGKKPTSPTPWSYFSLLDSFDIELPHNERARERERDRQTISLCNFHLWAPRARPQCLLSFLASPLVSTDSRGPLWSEGQGARQASVVTHLFIPLFITFAAHIFTIMLFCGLFAKCIVSQACFKCSLSWKRAALGAGERGGEGRKAVTETFYNWVIC